jgi:redox-sensing transcriptional repressor
MLVSEKTIERLCLYRRFLRELRSQGTLFAYSHELAKMAGLTAAQVRRDIMAIGYYGSPVRGYEVEKLSESISAFLDGSDDHGVALVGVGNLGRAILSYLNRRNSRLQVAAVFDTNPEKINRVVLSCRCYALENFTSVVQEKNIHTIILTVPAEEAQAVAEMAVKSGVNGILNFAPVHLNVPEAVFVENIDMAIVLEKVTYYAQQDGRERKDSVG